MRRCPGSPAWRNVGGNQMRLRLWHFVIHGQGSDHVSCCGSRNHAEHSGRRGRLSRSPAYILVVLSQGTDPKGQNMAAACPGLDSQNRNIQAGSSSLGTRGIPAWSLWISFYYLLLLIQIYYLHVMKKHFLSVESLKVSIRKFRGVAVSRLCLFEASS